MATDFRWNVDQLTWTLDRCGSVKVREVIRELERSG